MTEDSNISRPRELPSRVIVRKIKDLELSEEDKELIIKASTATGTIVPEVEVETTIYLIKRLEQSAELMQELIRRLGKSSKRMEWYTGALLFLGAIQIVMVILSLRGH